MQSQEQLSLAHGCFCRLAALAMLPGPNTLQALQEGCLCCALRGIDFSVLWRG